MKSRRPLINYILEIFKLVCIAAPLLFPFSEALGSPRIIFDKVDASDGLSNTAAQAILQDSNGFIWIGSQQGLNRYDGAKMEVFSHYPDDPSGLSNAWVYDLLEGEDGKIWVATDGGLDIFDPTSKKFTTFPIDPNGEMGLPHKSVRCLFKAKDGTIWIGTLRGLSRWEGGSKFTQIIEYEPDPSRTKRPGVRAIAETRDGTLWVGTQDNGLQHINPITGETHSYDYSAGGKKSTGDKYISSVFVDNDDAVWVGTRSGGLSRIDPVDRTVKRFTKSDAPGSLQSNGIWTIYQDREESVWIGTEGGGLSLWDPVLENFQTYKHDPADPISLADDVVYEIMQDDGDVLWVGTFSGISKWNRSIPTFTHLSRKDSTTNSLSNNKISSFQETKDGRIWIGTIGGGVNLWDQEASSFRSFEQISGDSSSLSDNRVMSLLASNNTTLWAGTMGAGINLLSSDGEIIQKYFHDEFDETSISSNKISDILQDESGSIWISTFGGALNKYIGNGAFERYPSKKEKAYQFSTSFIVDMELSHDGTIWLAGDGGGLMNFDPQTEKVTVHQHDPSNSNSVSGNHIIALHETTEALWVGTRDTGLNKLRDNTWLRFNRRKGIASGAIYGILEDEFKRLWISHGKGISVYHQRSNRFTNYNRTHGLQGEDFNNGASFKNSSGQMLFGGSNGFNIFNPSKIQGNRHVPPVVLSRFTKFNTETLLEIPTHKAKEIKLAYTDYVIGFEFAALDYTAPEKNQYRYKLIGFDKEWVETQNVRQATYTNLAPGKYIFRVQGSNNDGVWNSEGLSIDVSVAPPWWATWWAYTIYVILFIGVLYALSRIYKAKLYRAQQKRYSQQLEALVTERTQELQKEILGHKAAQSKLSASLGEKEVLLKEVHHRVKNNMQVISSLLNIQADSVDDERFVSLLTESQQRIKSMALIHENLYRSEDLLEINFNTYIEMLANGLLRFYRFDNLVVGLKLDVKNVFLDIDTAVPCGLIINELVSNALKHAYNGKAGSGTITIKFHPISDGSRYRFSVADDGVGVPDDFDIQSAPSMGLEIVRILTEQLDGNISINNQHGTEFIIEFPGA
jgi:two-component sensor histidine kinase/ligand-binding sensor domain-containing protein